MPQALTAMLTLVARYNWSQGQMDLHNNMEILLCAHSAVGPAAKKGNFADILCDLPSFCEHRFPRIKWTHTGCVLTKRVLYGTPWPWSLQRTTVRCSQRCCRAADIRREMCRHFLCLEQTLNVRHTGGNYPSLRLKSVETDACTYSSDAWDTEGQWGHTDELPLQQCRIVHITLERNSILSICCIIQPLIVLYAIHGPFAE